ncbi:MAG: NAD(P)-dependent oxidoreductase [Gammaproteobacteria bacterium]|nr:NAD(P)-dependent oxidoreductase [Gammaproteobacteria bacterium]MDH3429131.1 NAD(P)-dependent oxidoreductase [Gammaproteobacteria bacterium]MDH3432239.1 NAD(P)-dependent oxidoreductase [Gammaproteobacteria bacterium]
MATPSPNIKANRLDKAEIDKNFADLHEPLSRSEALIEADRCYFCFDAPCTIACPTGIDIPGFIQKIRSDNIRGSALTILRENIMGGMCARVCPTEVLCEEACVRNTHEKNPVSIGLLQRYATDPIFDNATRLFDRAQSSGKTVAVVGGGPAGLSCAHRLAMLGHDVRVFNRDSKLGGLNEYGIAAYKTVNDFAQREVDYILSIGGIEVENNAALGVDFHLADLRSQYDAVFLGIGLGSVNELGLENENLPGLKNAIDYIADLRQAEDKGSLPVGRDVVVVGGGMTAIDIAVQSKRLGAERVDIVYRRGPEQMGASRYEQDLARTNGVTIHHWAAPAGLRADSRGVITIELEKTELDKDGNLKKTGEVFTLEADVVFKAIGQKLDDEETGDELAVLDMQNGKIVVDGSRATSLDGVWAGGDCAVGGEDLTVSAVQDGKVAAMAIDRALRS